MTVRPAERKHTRLAALAASLTLLVTGLVTAAYAAPAHDTLCSETGDATLEVSENELSATFVNHEIEIQDTADDEVDALSAEHLLRPSAAATIREAFAGGDDAIEQTDELARFKRQMYRKDI
jgi:cytochrome c oxidase assembly protein Cox11